MTTNTFTPGHQTIGELRKGRCSEAIREALQEATERTKLTGKDSKVTITLTISKADKKAQAVEMVAIHDEVKTSLPKLPQSQSYYYVHPDTNALLTKNPQLEIEGVGASKSA